MSEKPKLVTPEAAPDPFDLDSLRLSQAFRETAGVKKLLRTVPIKKPGAQEFFRVHPAPEYRDANLALLEFREDSEFYLLPPAIADQLPGEYVPLVLYTAITRRGNVFLWPAKQGSSDSNSRVQAWYDSAHDAATLAMRRWIRIKANMENGAYDIHDAQGTIAEPEWPDVSFQDLIKIAFKVRLVDSLEHPAVKRLLGA
jgi:hypothetical protein